MTNVTATEYSISPSTGYGFAYVTGAKAAQNDTLTCSGFRRVYAAAGVVEPSSGDSAAETVTVDDTTQNMLNLTGAATGTFHGWIIGQPQ